MKACFHCPSLGRELEMYMHTLRSYRRKSVSILSVALIQKMGLVFQRGERRIEFNCSCHPKLFALAYECTGDQGLFHLLRWEYAHSQKV